VRNSGAFLILTGLLEVEKPKPNGARAARRSNRAKTQAAAVRRCFTRAKALKLSERPSAPLQKKTVIDATCSPSLLFSYGRARPGPRTSTV